jgi:cytochrome c-type biogenesis protein CcmE
MEDNILEQLKKDYEEMPIPQELDFVVRQAIRKSRSNEKKKKRLHKVTLAVASAVAAVAIFTVSINASPALAKTLAQVPVVGNIVKVLTFKEFTVDEDTFNANIKVPEISGLKDDELQSSLNEKYLQENEKLYEQFIADVEDMQENYSGGHLGLDSGYIVKTDTDKILSIGRYVVNTAASSSTTFKFDTIDKEKEILITLPSLFKDDSYIDIISEYIKEQMRRHYEEDEVIYWVEGAAEQEILDSMELFEKIAKEHILYILWLLQNSTIGLSDILYDSLLCQSFQSP